MADAIVLEGPVFKLKERRPLVLRAAQGAAASSDGSRPTLRPAPSSENGTCPQNHVAYNTLAGDYCHLETLKCDTCDADIRKSKFNVFTCYQCTPPWFGCPGCATVPA